MSQAILRVRFNQSIGLEGVPRNEFQAPQYDISLDAGVFTLVNKITGFTFCSTHEASWIPLVSEEPATPRKRAK